ncbi:MAG: 50S ribosomal protein L21e [Candidatus Pacearchaeota archaeon]
MAKGKQIREKGKIKLSSYFKKINEGDSVAINIDKGVNFQLPKRIQGRSGKVVGERGKCKIIEIKDGRKNKIYVLHPVHLRSLSNGN